VAHRSQHGRGDGGTIIFGLTDHEVPVIVAACAGGACLHHAMIVRLPLLNRCSSTGCETFPLERKEKILGRIKEITAPGPERPGTGSVVGQNPPVGARQVRPKWR
jgi:hypothetical protein